MEPTNSNSTNTPQYFSATPENNPEKKPRFSRKTLVILAVALIVVIVGVVIASSGSNKDQENQKSADNVYYDRPGIDRANLTEAIGDPAPLISKPGASPVSYKGTKVIQACNLITLEEIRKQGLQIYPNSLTAFERTYFDGQSQGKLDTFSTSLGSMGDSNSCEYPIGQKTRGSVSIDVYQPTYNQPSAIEYELGRYQARGTISGLARYERTIDETTSYLLRDGNSALLIDFRHVSKEAAAKLLATIAANYKSEKASPAGPIQFAYDSPVFRKSYLNGCSIIKASDVKQLFGTDVKPLVTEQVATATGVIYYAAGQDPTRYSRIDHACKRNAVSNGFSNRKVLTAETTSFTSEEAAKLEMASGRRLDSNVRTMSATIGDDVYFSDTTGNNPEMVIRKGRFVINLSMYDQTKLRMSAEQTIQLLTPIARSVVERVKD